MLVILCVCLVLLLTTTPTDSAPAPFTVEALLTAKLLGLAGLKGNFCFKITFCSILFTYFRISDRKRSRQPQSQRIIGA